MSGEQNKDVFRRVVEEGFNKGNLDALNDCFPPTYAEHQFDLPPTGRSFAITVIDVCRFENGKIVEHWGVPDRFHQLAQLGLLSSPAGQHG